MTWAELQSLFAGRQLLEIVDQISTKLPLLGDIEYVPTNDGFGLKHAIGADINISYGTAGNATVTAGGATVGSKTATMYEIAGLSKVPLSICNPNNKAEKLALYASLKAKSIMRYGLAYMFGYSYNATTGEWSTTNVGFNETSSQDGEYINCTVLDAKGTADANGLCDAWLVRWGLDGAMVGFPFFDTNNAEYDGVNVLGLTYGDPYTDTISSQTVLAQPIWWHVAPTSARPTAVVKIANLNHPLTANGKYLDENTLLDAFSLLDEDGDNMSLIIPRSQHTKFLKSLVDKSNLVVQVADETDVGLRRKVLFYNGAKIRPFYDIYHSHVVNTQNPS